MAERLGKAVLELATDKRGFDRDLNKAEKSARGLGERFAAVRGQVLAFSAAITAVGVGLFKLVKSAADFADQMGKTAQRVGIGVEALSGLKFAAELSDVSFQQLTTGIQRLSRNALDVAQGIGEAKDAFEALNITVRNNEGGLRTSEDLFVEIAEKLSRMEDGTLKTALAMQIFGRAGATMIPLLNSGAEGIRKMTEEAHRLGIIVSEETAAKARDFNDALTSLNAVIRGLTQTIGLTLIPAFFRLAQIFGLTLPESTTALRSEIGLLQKEIQELEQLGGNAFDRFFTNAVRKLSGKGSIAESLVTLRQQLAETQARLAEMEAARPTGPAPIIPTEEERAKKGKEGKDPAQDLAERTRAAVGDTLDALTAMDDELRVNEEERLRRNVELIEKIKQLEREATLSLMSEEQQRIEGIKTNLEKQVALVKEAAEKRLITTAETLRAIEALEQAAGEKIIVIMEEAAKERADKTAEALKKSTDQAKELSDALTRIGQSAGDALGRAIAEGRGFSEVLKQLLQDVIRLAQQQLFGGGGGGGGLFSGLFGGGGLFAGLFGGGGGFGAPGVETLVTGMGFQEGGIVPGPPNIPQLAMVHGGEEIIPAGERGAASTTVQINGDIIPRRPDMSERDVVRIVRTDIISRDGEIRRAIARDRDRTRGAR